ncbi:TPA: hypothetical protein J4344_004082 [Escherichia coli]|nr:hypothetical protein [Escherichia coli]HBA4645071.1 hypothetical protein [Escherichia coli]HBA4750393.1 hypothetical protein [Escherichia coli]HBA4754932.1 hypothetical protein [Escherichia coli]HBA4834372.1 hypothetical protein [Escherichia coli]
MTDITELAQSEINDALAQLKQISEYPTPSTQYARVLRKYILALVEALEKAQAINAAAEKLVRCKGRYHSEQNYRALAALFGVTTPDQPPLEHENVHYADAAEMEIAALRQRIAELESRTVKLPKPISVLHRREFTAAHCAIYAYPEAEVNAALDGAGIKWEAE